MFPDINIKGYFCPPILSHDELNEYKYISDLIEKNPIFCGLFRVP